MPDKQALPDLSLDEFTRHLGSASPVLVSPGQARALFAHYQELQRWNRTVSLIGPGTLAEIFARHYAESLFAVPLVREGCREIVDIGSGAGFPGLVLAAALPETRVTLTETRERKWAFLETAARRAALPARCLNARVRRPLPAGLPAEIDLLTARAIRLDTEILSTLAERMAPEGQILLWLGREAPAPLPGWELRREVRLPGSVERRIVELRRTGTPTGG